MKKILSTIKIIVFFACILLKKAGCKTENFNEMCEDVQNDLLKDKTVFETCLKTISKKDKEAMLLMCNVYQEVF